MTRLAARLVAACWLAAGLVTAALAENWEISPQVAARAEHLLAVHIGPLAKILVKKAATSAHGTKDFVAALADAIDDEEDRAAFLNAADREF